MSDARNDIFDQRLWAWQRPVVTPHDPGSPVDPTKPDYDPPAHTTRIVDHTERLQFYARTKVPINDPDDSEHTDPTRGPEVEGNRLWSQVFFNDQITINNTKVFERPQTPDEPDSEYTVDVRGYYNIKIYNADDPLRFKIMKCLTVAMQQATSVEEFKDLKVYRGFSLYPDQTQPSYVVNIQERQIIDRENVLNMLERQGASTSDQHFEILISGWPPSDINRQSNKFQNTDQVYPLMEVIRGRINTCKLDENKDKRVFRLANRNNCVLNILSGDGTVNADEKNNPGFYIRLIIVVVEDLADSTYGD